jgi:hypothetical protein
MNKLIICLLAILSITLSAQTESRVEITEDGLYLILRKMKPDFFKYKKGSS